MAGTWTTRCSQDPRFNMSGTAPGMCSSESELNKAILAKQKELGLDDAAMDKLVIEISFCKD